MTCSGQGSHEFPLVQARANRGILYVDEVNLLDDGLVDVVLDSAASGLNTVEREGVSIIHPAKFIMLGSGNPQVCLHLHVSSCIYALTGPHCHVCTSMLASRHSPFHVGIRNSACDNL